MALKKRSQVLAFYEIPSSTINRMTNFTSLSKSMNPKEYSREYVDIEGEVNDVVSYSPSIEYAFDCMTENAVHADIVSISDGAKTGTDAERNIYSVDLTKPSGSGYVCYKKPYAVIPDAEGDSMDAYTYGGSFKSKGVAVKGVAVLNSDKTVITTFTPDAGAEYLVTINVSSVGGQVADAQVVINSQIIKTDANGIARIYLPAGTYPYSVSKALYTTKSDSATVTAAAVYETITLVLA
jgi:hypothetical protein